VLLHAAAADRADAAARRRGGAGLDHPAAPMVRRHNASALRPGRAPGALGGADPNVDWVSVRCCAASDGRTPLRWNRMGVCGYARTIY